MISGEPGGFLIDERRLGRPVVSLADVEAVWTPTFQRANTMMTPRLELHSPTERYIASWPPSFYASRDKASCRRFLWGMDARQGGAMVRTERLTHLALFQLQPYPIQAGWSAVWGTMGGPSANPGSSVDSEEAYTACTSVEVTQVGVQRSA